MIILDSVSVSVTVDGEAIAEGLNRIAEEANGVPANVPNLRANLEELIAQNVKVEISAGEEE